MEQAPQQMNLGQTPPMTTEAINDLRKRVLAGETVSPDELRAAIATLRQNRLTAMTQAKTSKAKKSANAEAELNDLLGGLGL